MMTEPSCLVFADVEVYADEAAAVAALRPPLGQRRAPVPALPEWATPPEVVEIDGVTRLRPNDAAVRDECVRLGQRYRDLVRHYGRDRLVLNMADLRPFGHPFHDDLFLVLGALGQVGGRLAICGNVDWYVERLSVYRFIRVVSGVPTD
jgi:hypothetical protein